jgi:hypothetical protein
MGRKLFYSPFGRTYALQHIESQHVIHSSEKPLDHILTKNILALSSARPDYNQAFMQELVVPMYFKKYVIGPEMNEKSYLEC